MENYIFEINKSLLLCFVFFIAIDLNKKITNKSVSNKNILNKNTNSNNLINIKDVLYINGCKTWILPHPFRYRVLHQMEQLSAGFLESDEIFYLDIEPLIVRNYRVIIFFRCPWTKTVEEAILLAKRLNKKVLFDIDDLIIDKKYTKLIPYLKTLTPKEKIRYDEGVKRIRKTLKLCEGAITTTLALAKELKHYVPNVYINRNVASEKMWLLSKIALEHKKRTKKENNIIIGYFSGSITHNSDILMIKSALIRILREFQNIKILFLGELSFPNFLKEFSSRIITKNFTDWKKLPEIISSVDINIAPIEKTIFNAAKSENKWVEASLVKVPTISSNFGAFKNVIIHNKTGLLCSNINDWYVSLKTLIINERLRAIIGENAYKACQKKYNTIYTGRKFANHINSIANKHAGFFLPSIEINGGIYVILKHACYLKDEGWDVDIIVPKSEKKLYEFQEHIFNIISLKNVTITVQYDIIIATFYSTLFTILSYYRTKRRLYLVQNYETDFYPSGHSLRSIAEKTYSTSFNIEYITISKWCRNWLWNKYRKKSKYAPNGIDLNNYFYYRRKLNKSKIRILIEGDSTSHYKNVDESFQIIKKLDKTKFEIWYLSYRGKPKDWYRFDKFFYDIPFENVSQIYNECDILLKSSWLESFSYPPLEMMATGGFCIVAPNGGNKEYLKDGENCLFYKLGNIDSAIKCIEKLISDEQLQQHLYEKGLETARNRDWKLFKKQIISLYDN